MLIFTNLIGSIDFLGAAAGWFELFVIRFQTRQS